MIYSLTVEDYQSIRKAHIDLGWFTVITGHTGSGKSSLFRAAELLVFNARGTSYIRHGSRICQVVLGVDTDDGAASVGIQRGGRGKDSYAIRLGTGEEQIYTKLDGKVPGDISSLLRLSNLNFAAQFDRPYLLDSSGGEVARTLGRLTNVTVLFSAAREANRRRLEVARQQRDVQERLQAAREDAQRFRGLPRRKMAVQNAESHLRAAQEAKQKLDRLSILASRLQDAAHQVKSQPPPAEVPDLAAAVSLQERAARVRQLLTFARSQAAARTAAVIKAREALEAQKSAEQQYAETLRRAGRCPTCGQSTHS